MVRDEQLVEYVAGLYQQYPDIRPYDMEDWDFTWSDEGYQFLESCDFGMAELTFQRLIAARPDHPDGFEGLALVYQALGIRDWAVLLIEEAWRLADQQVAQDLMDQEVLADIIAERDRIRAMPQRPVADATDDETLEEEA